MRPAVAALLLVGLPAAAFAYGEPSATDVPNHEERLLHVLTNQIRQAPHDWPGWDTSLATADARPPLLLQAGLEAAARAHADDMATHHFFSHDSSDGTPFMLRIGHYFQGPAGENIYTASSGGARDAMTAWMNSTGHRTNILQSGWTSLGPGMAQKDGALYYVQDFGIDGMPAIPAIPGGALELGSGGMVTLLANFYDAHRRSPKSITAVLGAKTVALLHAAGSPGNETYSGSAPWPTGCERLSFTAVDADGSATLFPSTGALLAGAQCTATYTAASMGSGAGDKTPVVIDADTPKSGCSCVVARRARSQRR